MCCYLAYKGTTKCPSHAAPREELSHVIITVANDYHSANAARQLFMLNYHGNYFVATQNKLTFPNTLLEDIEKIVTLRMEISISNQSNIVPSSCVYNIMISPGCVS